MQEDFGELLPWADLSFINHLSFLNFLLFVLDQDSIVLGILRDLINESPLKLECSSHHFLLSLDFSMKLLAG